MEGKSSEELRRRRMAGLLDLQTILWTPQTD